MHIGAWRAIAALGCAALLPATLAAQESTTLNRFSASALPADDFQVDRPIAPGHLKWGAIVHVDYALDPLIFQGREGTESSQEVTVVGDHMTANAALSLGLSDRALLFVGLPVTLWMDGQDNPSAGGTALVSADDAGLGAAYAGARAVLLGNRDTLLSLAVQAAVTLPTAGSDQRFRGEDSLSAAPQLLLALSPGAGLRITANVGGRFRKTVEDASSNLEFGSELTYALGLAKELWHGPRNSHLELHAQAFGGSLLSELDESPVEALFGVKYFSAGGLVLGAGAGPGITRGLGSPEVRALVTLGYQTPFEEEPDRDSDQDGLLDKDDSCPLEPETRNGLEDDDGCPDAWGDRDRDSLPDNVDSCPDEPEDVDDFEDADGCPDPDNDQDEVLDVSDACPLEKGSPTNKGCPVLDRDGDTVPDAVDNCPDEPGSVDNHGCVVKQQVEIHDAGLRILEKVYFRTSKAVIQKRSFELLDNVASVLTAHPELTRVIVEGHTDARGNRAFNLKLSRARADAVVEFLVKAGVSRERLVARGYGPDVPLVSPARSSSDHAANRRVEFSTPSKGAASELRDEADSGQP